MQVDPDEDGALRDGAAQCPCCDFYSLQERGSFEICPVCYWEDDGQDLDRLDEVSGPNHITLRAARLNFERLGAADAAAVSLVATPAARAGLRREQRATYF
ncbi:MAG: CPCC family cysteine-rich protein [Planctomycetota bacterium]